MATSQVTRGQEKFLITGSAALFYNKLGDLQRIESGTDAWSYNDASFGWDALTGTLTGATTGFAIGSDYYEMPSFTSTYSYGYELEQAELTSGQGAAYTALTTYPDYLGDGKYHPFGTIGYTTNGLSITFTPEWGEIQVDQLLDAARIFKTGQTAALNTTIAEATLENLAIALAVPEDGYPTTYASTSGDNIVLDLDFGSLYECPVERALVAVGPGLGSCEVGQSVERVYTAYRTISQEAVTVSMSRNDPQTYDVSFRLMPNSSGSYGRVVDRIIDDATVAGVEPADPYLAT